MSSPESGTEPRLLWVQKHPDSPDDRVAIYDRDPAHPASKGNPPGELYIADRFPRLVAETAAVNQKLQRTPGGPPDLRVLREDEAQEIASKMEEEEKKARAETRERLRRQQEEDEDLLPTPTDLPSAAEPTEQQLAAGGADTRTEAQGVSTAVESGPMPGSGEGGDKTPPTEDVTQQQQQQRPPRTPR